MEVSFSKRGYVYGARAYGVDWRGRELWLPKSRCGIVSDDGETVTIEVPQWLCDREGLTGFEHIR